MFKQLRNIDSAFRHIRTFSLLFLLACTLVCGLVLYFSHRQVQDAQERVYVLAAGKALEAFASSRSANLAVEARDHIRSFHYYFFTLAPDKSVIEAHLSKAMHLADASARRVYDNLRESGYYSDLVAGTISQEIFIDSIQVNLDQVPFYFRCYARQKLTRSTSVLTRSLLTEGTLRPVPRSDHNPHGFLIERWSTIENRDLNTTSR
ncbi:conjugative transposon protein TraK [Pontibacter sp. Tf4]|uniref:conjugative transposon protein TraK n=1 Tax=Pontibacter sp. Tf4 TaxID=2761620 RepID=UPI0016254474|nr:conjugative transposon protein TraK [Pontibacter sp. Tf4]MBB6611816.1 conjugative transposon protein TraK [Pontibacter sp. Tf4]